MGEGAVIPLYGVEEAKGDRVQKYDFQKVSKKIEAKRQIFSLIICSYQLYLVTLHVNNFMREARLLDDADFFGMQICAGKAASLLRILFINIAKTLSRAPLYG